MSQHKKCFTADDNFHDTRRWITSMRKEIPDFECVCKILKVTECQLASWNDEKMPSNEQREMTSQLRRRILSYEKIKKEVGLPALLRGYTVLNSAKKAASANKGAAPLLPGRGQAPPPINPVHLALVSAKTAASAEGGAAALMQPGLSTGAPRAAGMGPPVGRGAPPGAGMGPPVGRGTSAYPPSAPPAASVSAPAAAGSEFARLQQAMFTVLFNRLGELEETNKQLEIINTIWMQLCVDALNLNEGLWEILGAYSHA